MRLLHPKCACGGTSSRAPKRATAQEMLPLWAAVLLLGSAAANVPRAVVINLPRHEARLAKVREELQAAALPFERLPAVDGRALPAEALRANVTALGRHLLTPGMIGCFLSHRRCWLKCVETGEPLIVFEDDAVLMPNFRQRLQAAMADLPASWDILLLGAFGCVRPDGVYGPKNIFRLFGWVGGGTRRIRTLPGAAGLHVPWRPYGTHAYMVSPAGAKKLLAACPRANFHVDNVAWGVKSLELYCVHPLMAKQVPH
jgi:glycosyl transferase family 25